MFWQATYQPAPGARRAARERAPRRGRGAFTFIEILAAMLMLAVLLPVIVGGLGLASRAAACAERDGVALGLAENQLNLLVTDTNSTAAATSGDFAPDWPAYRWNAERTAWPSDDMALLTLTVSYQVRGQGRDVRLSTLVKGTSQ